MIKTLRKSLLADPTQSLYTSGEAGQALASKLKLVKPAAVYDLKSYPGSYAGFSTSSYHPLQNGTQAFLKRGFDIVFSCMVCVFILSWLVPIIAVLIKLESKGPVFFKQLRTGKDNKPFLCYKFRSLRMNDEADQKQVTTNDSRVTKIGKFLRKSSIDELPQFLNVLSGHMSIVGPRPHMLKHTEEFSTIVKNYKARHTVKPGVTGLAQISGFRGEILHQDQLVKRVEHDFSYIRNWNILLDLKIIYRTVYNAIKGDENAY